MTSNDDQRSGQAGAGGAVRRAVILSGAVLVAALVAIPIGYSSHGQSGLMAVGVALAICLISGCLALFVAQLFQRPDLVLYQVLFNMAIRMGIPLAICMVIYGTGGLLVKAGMVYYLLAFYFVMLIVETTMMVVGNGNGVQGSARAS